MILTNGRFVVAAVNASLLVGQQYATSATAAALISFSLTALKELEADDVPLPEGKRDPEQERPRTKGIPSGHPG